MRHLMMLIVVTALAAVGCSDNFNFGPGEPGGGGQGGGLEGGGGSVAMDGGGGTGGHGGVEPSCDEGGRICDGDAALVCEDGAFVLAQDCALDGALCVMGSCESDLALRLGFDEQGGGQTVDDVDGLVGTLSNVFWTQGRVGSALGMSGEGQVVFGDALNDLALPFTITAWVKIPADVDAAMTILATDGSMPYQGIYLVADFASGPGQVTVGFGNAGGSGPANRHGKMSSVPVPTDVWAHVAGVFRLPGDADIFIDGADAGGVYSGAAAFVASTADPVVVGTSLAQGAALTGTVDDVRVYRRALTAAEVAAIAGAQ